MPTRWPVADVDALRAEIARLQARQEAMVAEIAALAGESRRREAVSLRPLLAAITAVLGAGRFSARSLLERVDDDPHGELSLVVEQLVDLNGQRPAVALGRHLSVLHEAGDLRRVGSRGGVFTYQALLADD